MLIEDSRNNRFFQIGLEEQKILNELREKSLETVALETSNTKEDLEDFIKSLSLKGILARPLLNKELIPKPPKKTIFSLLSKRFPLWNPDKPFTEINQKYSWLWKAPLFYFHILTIIFTAFLWFDSSTTFIKELNFNLFYNPIIDLTIFFAIVFLILAFHEVAHGLTLKSYGGNVPEIGLFFIYGIPTAYTNVSSAYKLEKRSQKALVVLAGILFQAWIGSVAYIIWYFSYAGGASSAIHKLAHLFVTASFFNLIINLNPLIKLDGYYLLTLVLNQPNLRAKATNLLRTGFKEVKSFNEGLLLFIYWIYSLYLVFIIFSFFGMMFLNIVVKNAPVFSGILLLFLIIAGQIPLAEKKK